MIDQIEAFCFDKYCTDMQELNIYGKKVFIFASHATAIRAWFKQAKESKLNLITFDEHTDTFPPLLRYRNSQLGYKDKELINILDNFKERFSDEGLRKLLLAGGYLQCKKEENGYGIDTCKLWNDEHITTAMMLGIINEAFICCDTSDDPSCNIDSVRVSNLYKNIHYLEKAFQVDTISSNHEGDSPKSLQELGYIYQLREKNISDARLNTLYESGLKLITPYILDIDLDYFRDISVLDYPLETYRAFGDLVNLADCITIATEPDYVKEASDGYNYNVRDYNEVCRKENRLPYHHWDSKTVLMKLLTIIEYSLKNH